MVGLAWRAVGLVSVAKHNDVLIAGLERVAVERARHQRDVGVASLRLICRRSVVLPVWAVVGLLRDLVEDAILAADILISAIDPYIRRLHQSRIDFALQFRVAVQQVFVEMSIRRVVEHLPRGCGTDSARDAGR